MLINSNTRSVAISAPKAAPKTETPAPSDTTAEAPQDKFSVSNTLRDNFSAEKIKKRYSASEIGKRALSGVGTGLVSEYLGGGSVAATAGISALDGGVGGALAGGLAGGLIGGLASGGKDAGKKAASGALTGAVVVGSLGAASGAVQGAVIATVANAVGGGPLAYAATGALMGVLL